MYTKTSKAAEKGATVLKLEQGEKVVKLKV